MTTLDLHLGDCLTKLPNLETASIDLVVTSPPYNLGIAYQTYRDQLDGKAYLTWCHQWCSEVARVLGDDGSFFLNIGGSPSQPLLPHQLLLALTSGENPLFVLQNTIHWVKSITVESRQGDLVSAGHFKPINSTRYVNDCHEYVFHLTKSGKVPLDRRGAGVPYADKSNIARWGHTGGQDRRCRGNNWFIPYDTITSRAKDRPHPASFPVALVEQCIRLHGKGSDTRLLDPFLGIGTSALAAKRQQITSFTGIELDPGYLEVARERLAEEDSNEEFAFVR